MWNWASNAVVGLALATLSLTAFGLDRMHEQYRGPDIVYGSTPAQTFIWHNTAEIKLAGSPSRIWVVKDGDSYVTHTMLCAAKYGCLFPKLGASATDMKAYKDAHGARL